ncbi:MAG: HAD-IA family hydrolase [Phycisphaerales bacterium]|jgi:HAD superfamily hydrolase (TIGR01509 family)|nr:HAD-IA family hydrolase [Phycisphaerales bacterium]
MPLRGIIFDMDGVLCDSEPFICEAACRMFMDVHGQKVLPADFLPFVGAGEDRYLGGVAEKYGVKLNMPADKTRTYDIYLQIIKGRLHPLPGVREFVSAAKTNGLRLAVATSADRPKLEGNLRQIELPASEFDAVVTGSEIARKKPHPDIFLLAAERLGLAPADCMVIEDAVNGLQAAVAAGCRTLGLTTSFDDQTLRKAGAQSTAPDLAHVKPPSGS